MKKKVWKVASVRALKFIESFNDYGVCLPLCVCACVYFMGVNEVVDVSKRISDVPEWFKGARLNYAENLLKHADQDKVALYAASKYMDCATSWVRALSVSSRNRGITSLSKQCTL